MNSAFELHDEIEIHDTAFVAPNATVTGRVRVGPQASIWFGVVIRAEHDSVVIGPRSNIQDGAVIHVDEGFPVLLGEDVTVGHRAVIHGATIESGCVIGIGAIVLNGAHIGPGSMVAAGALVPEGKVFPGNSLVMGVPAKVVRTLTPADQERMRLGVTHYLEFGAAYARRFDELP
jgi:carbonic anhydrase/acetyltransferase-like protein (isoleucine patch superfamily)